MMRRHVNEQPGREAPKTEPVIIPEVFANEIEVQIYPEYVRTIYYSSIGGDHPERRVVARIIRPVSVLRDAAVRFLEDLRSSGHS